MKYYIALFLIGVVLGFMIKKPETKIETFRHETIDTVYIEKQIPTIKDKPTVDTLLNTKKKLAPSFTPSTVAKMDTVKLKHRFQNAEVYTTLIAPDINLVSETIDSIIVDPVKCESLVKTVTIKEVVKVVDWSDRISWGIMGLGVGILLGVL